MDFSLSLTWKNHQGHYLTQNKTTDTPFLLKASVYIASGKAGVSKKSGFCSFSQGCLYIFRNGTKLSAVHGLLCFLRSEE